jgi:hypothetical protein
MGRFCCPDVVAEVEEEVGVMFEGELEDRMEPIHEIESAKARGRRSCCASVRSSISKFIFMTAPKFSAAHFADRGATITRGPVDENK